MVSAGSAHAANASALRFAIDTLGIWTMYWIFGYYQQQLTSGTYGDGSSFPAPLFLVLCQCCGNTLLAAATYRRGDKHFSHRAEPCPWHKFWFLSLTYIGAMTCTNLAAKQLSYPAVALTKASKMISIMFVGVLLHRKRYSFRDWLLCVLLVGGVMIFSYRPADSSKSSTVVGLLLAFGSLALDGLTNTNEDAYVERYRITSSELMLKINVMSVANLLVACLVTGEVSSALDFLSTHHDALLHVGLYALLSAIGQQFVFDCLTHFGSLRLSLVTTTRKFGTVAISIIAFGITISKLQVLGMVMVVGSALWPLVEKLLRAREEANTRKEL